MKLFKIKLKASDVMKTNRKSKIKNSFVPRFNTMHLFLCSQYNQFQKLLKSENNGSISQLSYHEWCRLNSADFQQPRHLSSMRKLLCNATVLTERTSRSQKSSHLFCLAITWFHSALFLTCNKLSTKMGSQFNFIHVAGKQNFKCFVALSFFCTQTHCNKIPMAINIKHKCRARTKTLSNQTDKQHSPLSRISFKQRHEIDDHHQFNPQH